MKEKKQFSSTNSALSTYTFVDSDDAPILLTTYHKICCGFSYKHEITVN